MGSRLAALVAIATLASCGDDPSALQRSGTRGTGTSSGNTGSSSGEDTGSSSGSSGGGDTPSNATGSAAEVCVATINEYRKTKGLTPYARWTEAEACSDGEAGTDAMTGRAHGAFGRCMELGQNECPGWQGPAEKMIPQCLKAMWGEGPGGGHYEAMASKRYTKVACGFATAANGGIWSVQNFR